MRRWGRAQGPGDAGGRRVCPRPRPRVLASPVHVPPQRHATCTSSSTAASARATSFKSLHAVIMARDELIEA
jgi:hypothetical protein